MQFHSKMAWPPATYDVVSGSHSNRPSLNFSFKMRARDKPIVTENGRCWCLRLLEKNFKKPDGGGGGGAPPCTSEGYEKIQ